MKTEKVLLSQVKVNEANPRTIKAHKLRLLMERMIVFPKMIMLRPVVVDNAMVALGGNMRIKALTEISTLSIDEITSIASKTKNFQRLTKVEQDALIAHWQKWLDKPNVEIARASELTDAEKQEFIIADNASFGEWDYDALANEWDAIDLNSWGVDVWTPEKDNGNYGGFGGGYSGGLTSVGAGIGTDVEPVNSMNGDIDIDSLPAELQGQDIDPDELPIIQGDNETAMDRIIIVYSRDRAEELAQHLGLESLSKVVYNLDEVFKD